MKVNTLTKKHTVLVIEDEAAVARMMERALQTTYNVRLAAGALEGFHVLESEPIDLVLLDISLPGLTGLELCGRIKEDVLLRHTPVIFVTGMARIDQRINGLRLGADDYLTKPFNMEELIARSEAAIRRRNLNLEANPLTKLPGNGTIEKEILKAIQSRETFSVLYADLNNFKAYNDFYGFHRGDEVILATARILLEASQGYSNLVAHLGGDDFIVISREDEPARLCQKIIALFDETAPQFYDPVERQAKSITTRDRRGQICVYPLLSIAIGVVTNKVRPLDSIGEVAAIGAEVKGVAKRQPGSAFFIDRRTTPYLGSQLTSGRAQQDENEGTPRTRF
jgi:diguanylate cyclase (GGDEF)-like protein